MTFFTATCNDLLCLWHIVSLALEDHLSLVEILWDNRETVKALNQGNFFGYFYPLLMLLSRTSAEDRMIEHVSH